MNIKFACQGVFCHGLAQSSTDFYRTSLCESVKSVAKNSGFTLLDDLRDHIILVELRHHVDAARPALDLVDQPDGQFHPDFASVFSCILDALPHFIRDEDP